MSLDMLDSIARQLELISSILDGLQGQLDILLAWVIVLTLFLGLAGCYFYRLWGRVIDLEMRMFAHEQEEGSGPTIKTG